MKLTAQEFFQSSSEEYSVLLMDPAWDLGTSTQKPTRGLTLGYKPISDADFEAMRIDKVIKNGVVGVWVVNSKIELCLRWMRSNDVRPIEYVAWIKRTRGGKMKHHTGSLLRRNKELLILGLRGKMDEGLCRQRCGDVLNGEVRESHRKPDAVYEMLEAMVPKAKRVEVFARRWNCRDNWDSIGLEV